MHCRVVAARVPELADKVKVCLAGDPLAGQLCRNIPCMNINDNQSAENLALQLAELPSDLVHNLQVRNTTYRTRSRHL